MSESGEMLILTGKTRVKDMVQQANSIITEQGKLRIQGSKAGIIKAINLAEIIKGEMPELQQ